MPASILRSALAAILLTLLGMQSATAEKREFKDVLGRSVVVDVPVKRAVIGMYLEDVLAVGGNGITDRIVGISAGTMRDWTAGKWRAYVEKLPILETMVDVGEVEAGTFSIEKVIAAHPDLVVLAAWQATSLGPNLDKIVAAGIPVVVIDYNSQTLERHVASTVLLGSLLGTESRARQLVDEYSSAVGDVKKRVAAAGKPQPKTYIELGNKGPGQFGNSYGKVMWGQLIEMAGGDNIAKDKVGNWGPLTAEAILEAQPDHIFISGGDWPGNAVALKMGFGITESEARAKLAEFNARPGWSGLPAGQQKRVHAVSQSMIRSLHDYTQLQFMAKMLYPEAFIDVDPSANLKRFYATYLPVEPKGVFMLSGQSNH
jgi:iron complex transport system substrate-binding protein